MTEPITTGGGAVALYKLLSLLLGASLATVVVMAMTRPRTTQEWVLSLVCTVISSFCGGSALVMWLGLQAWAMDFFGLIGLIGVVFSCGLPGWVVVRWWFTWVVKNPDRNPLDAVREVRDSLR